MFRILPSAIAVRMKSITPKRLQVVQLHRKEPIHVLSRVDVPVGHFGRELHLLAMPAAKGPAEKGLARPHVVGHRGIDVVDAAIDCGEELSLRPLLVDPAALLGEPHAAVAEGG